ncbi:MAG TPA: ribonuclease HII [Candidatus Paceibacterota bacterium]|nr:ribonuclease HII [Candidatus Paceibacterota bacterium]
MDKKFEWYIGIDEVGRGPLAGPITICAAAFRDRKPRALSGIKDSKKLSGKQKGEWKKEIEKEKSSGRAVFCISSSDHLTIDDMGMTQATALAINEALDKLDLDPEKCLVLLDGGLKAPEKFIYQETIIKGDEKERVISAASIIAKIDRDSLMDKYSGKYPEYGFHLHKGYGTRAHYEALEKHGPCEIHRKSFLSSLRKQ